MRKRNYILIALITLQIVYPASAQTKQAANTLPAEIMDVEFLSLNGSAPIKLSNYKREVMVVAFLTSWCPPCEVVVSDLIDFNDEFSGRVEVIGLTVKSSQTDDEWIRGFAGKKKINFNLGWLSQKAVNLLVSKQQTVPHILVIDADGRIVKKFDGWSKQIKGDLHKTVDQVLAKASSTQ